MDFSLNKEQKQIQKAAREFAMAVDLYDENQTHLAVAQVNYFLLGKK